MATTAEALAQAIEYHMAGQLPQAEQLYRQILEVEPAHALGWHSLGILAEQQGRRPEALNYLREAVRLAPGEATFHNNLGLVLQRLGQLDEASSCYRQALDLRLDFPEAHNHLGNVLRQLGRLDEAIASYRQAVQLRPDFFGAHNNLGNVFRDRGQLDEALACYRQALDLQPDWPEIHNNLGNVLRDRGQLDDARACYRQALRLRPDYAEAHDHLGNTLQDLGRTDEAIACYRQALQVRFSFPEAHNHLGAALRDQGQEDAAEDCFHQALELQPGLAEAHDQLGLLCAAQGKTAEAEAHWQCSLRLKPNPAVRLTLALLLPMIYQSRDEVGAWRRRLTDNIRQLRQENFTLDVTTQLPPTPFWLVYQGGDHRDLLRELTPLYVPPPDPPRPAPAVRQRGKIKVGFISHYFWNHTIARLMRGWIAQLSRDTFTVTALAVGRSQDALAGFIQQQADVFLEVPAHLPAARRLIAEQELDVLIYTDIGMDPVTYALAFSRLAPVQCVAWGHAVTTGIKTLDYFLSSELLETAEGDQHYTERLVRLPNLGVYYYRPEPPAPLKGRSEFGLPEEVPLYACLQTLFKFHPDFDALLGGILRRDRRGVLVLLHPGKFGHYGDLLRQRLAATLPDVLDRILFLPPQPNPDYLNLMALADVLLDPPYNVGGNNSFEGFAMGTPIVTQPTRHLVGRLTGAMYAQMGLADGVAGSAAEYVDGAVRLGTDAAHRVAVRDKIRWASAVLFENPAGVRGLEQFLQKAVRAV